MNTGRDDAARDLVQHAYAADPEPCGFDVDEGLQEILDQARQREMRATSSAHGHVKTASVAGGSQTVTIVARDFTETQALDFAEKGAIFVMGSRGGIRVSPHAKFTIVFGRAENDVHVALGVGDSGVSCHQGDLEYKDGRWWLRNTGRSVIRLPNAELLLCGQAVPLPVGYTPVFVVTSRAEHLLELTVTGHDTSAPQSSPDVSIPRRNPQVPWVLSRRERLTLVVLSQRYLRHETHPLPLTARQAATQLADLDPNTGWTAKRVARIVAGVRYRLAASGAPGLIQAEFDPPVGNSLIHNLIMKLLESATLVPQDLALINEEEQKDDDGLG
ncbi:hypothetical protein E1287_39195 [Actinomadura sp. KC06]|uniref:hypothetical protein n=1 Tax=Actinomadura sp. KC06 TaxID=2530369 RepID=UPI00104354B4|nr:hypothetical protein [Actinomadura sp. KC06]TDD23199.1 hypothetical protein E1287_39195 [Actinomadura sp. KC06]